MKRMKYIPLTPLDKKIKIEQHCYVAVEICAECALVFCLCIENYFYSSGINFCWMWHEHLRFHYISNGLNSAFNTIEIYAILYTTSKMWMITALILPVHRTHTQLPLWEIFKTHTYTSHRTYIRRPLDLIKSIKYSYHLNDATIFTQKTTIKRLVCAHTHMCMCACVFV